MTSNEIYARVKANEFVNAPTHRVNVIDKNGVVRLSRPCWGLDMAESIAADREGEIDGCTVEIVEQGNRAEIQSYWDKENGKNAATPTTDTTPATMNANETKAPEFSELSHAATNIVLAAENTASLYENHVEPLLRSLERKAAKGVTLSLDTLAKSSAMAVIIRESIKEVKRTSYDPFSANTDDRRAAALYLANIYIGEL